MERNRYFYGKLLTVRDFETEQNYADAKRRLINRALHGAGVVCGLGVSAGDDTTLLIESGMALDYIGREIVLEEPLVRRLEMIEGYDALRDREDAYLCLAYNEEDVEPVNAVGADAAESRQCNMTREGYTLSFSTEAPEYRGLLEATGKENVSVIYAAEQLTLVFYCASAACAGDEFTLGVLVVKTDKTPPVSFTLEGESGLAESENGRVSLSYAQAAGESRNVVKAEFKLRAQSLSDVEGKLFHNGAELNIELGSHRYKNIIDIPAELAICADRAAYMERRRAKDSLNKRLRGNGLPIYLAKLELVPSTGRVFLGTVTNLPFEQSIAAEAAAEAGGGDRLEVSTSVEALEYWQKPDVRASFDQQANSLRLNFGIPTPEMYDYTTSHGVAEIPMPGGIKVNARYMTEEIPHGLGPGNVEVRLAVEFGEGENAHLFGNSEVFRTKNSAVNPPWAEVAAVVYPARGTMRIGVWMHDNIEGNLVRVHYYAQKPERDTKRLIENRQASVSVVPEVTRLGRREQTRFKAVVQGSADKAVIWAVKDENGGAIDQNGIYQAPEAKGTYEIIAKASADDRVAASAYVIVE